MMDSPETATRASTEPSGCFGGEGFAPGTVLDNRYRIIALLGRGGMGEVYRADDLRLGQQVSLKFLPSRYEHDHIARGRLVTEARNARAVAHPHVCRVYDVGDIAGRLFLTMEYIDGEDLASLLRRIGRLPPTKAHEIAQQLCAGLAAAHERGVLHRDLKPSNVMLDGRGRARITDFGLAVDSKRDGSPADFSGTLAYMAPERMQGTSATVQSDLYALGLVLYELSTGTMAFKASTVEEWRRAHERFQPTPPSDISGDVDPALERAILWCLEKSPAARPSSAALVAAVLPGGDPLLAAIEAGDTPSPDIVAAAGEEGTLSRTQAWLCVGGCAASVALAVMAWAWILLANAVTFAGSPDVLRAAAVGVLRSVGQAPSGGDDAWWYHEDRALRDLRLTIDTPAARFSSPSDALPVSLSFRYRWNPDVLIPLDAAGFVSTGDPRPEIPGDATVHLDATGRLTFLRIVPQAGRVQTALVSPAVWDRLFQAAGLASSSFQAVEPEGYPPVPFERLLAWKGAPAGQRLRIAAAEAGGRPVFFRVSVEASPPFEPGERHPQSRAGAKAVALAIGWMLTIAVLAVLARRNLRLGRGDRRGAGRIALVLLATIAASGIAGRHWAFEPVSLWTALSHGQGYALFTAAMIWLYYLGFEPFARRRWPHILIAWTRLITGRWRDPLVGQSVLAGVALGGVLAAFGALPEGVGRLFALPDAVPYFWPESLNDPWRYMASLTEAPVNGVRYGFAVIALMLIVRLVTASEPALQLAVGGMAAVVAWSGAEPRWLDLLQAVLIGGTMSLTIRRLGLLCFVVAVTVNYLVRFTPWTFDPNAWFVFRPALTAIMLAALTAWGFRSVLGRQSLLPGGRSA